MSKEDILAEKQIEFADLYFMKYCLVNGWRHPIQKAKLKWRLAVLCEEVDRLDREINEEG